MKPKRRSRFLLEYKMNILLIEDEKRMAEALAALLRKENFTVSLFTDGLQGLEAAKQNTFDLILLDLMLPGLSGIEIARCLRAAGQKTPIIMLTAKSELDDKVLGLDSGADDYLTKPFEVKELLARIRVIQRRHLKTSDDTIAFGDIKLNTLTGLLNSQLENYSVQLSKKELQIMTLMIAHKNQVVTREQLVLALWGYECESEYNNVEVYLTFTRKKLAFIHSTVEIKAIRGIGYTLRYSHV